VDGVEGEVLAFISTFFVYIFNFFPYLCTILKSGGNAINSALNK
jgi:hypothetical protein